MLSAECRELAGRKAPISQDTRYVATGARNPATETSAAHWLLQAHGPGCCRHFPDSAKSKKGCPARSATWIADTTGQFGEFAAHRPGPPAAQNPVNWKGPCARTEPGEGSALFEGAREPSMSYADAAAMGK